ncbi:hypothetical protein [Massilia glaciei]|uniref:Uncharacterized protein n=1 Tax=Massilia glaciei TaxID=1524097 RepID=A0A2U2HFP6_9BURK|nr:hypothetical protein [Massilia glaciei]PWF43161.1 hypothetical protein C7C56_021415 [Massilia glaciei]
MPTEHKTGPIATKFIKRFHKSHRQKTAGPATWWPSQAERDALAADTASRARGEPGMAAFDLYNNVQNWALGAMEAMQDLPELAALMARAEAEQDAYMPGYPPMSPITHTYFWPWMLYDMSVNANGETFAGILLSLGREFNLAPAFLDTLASLSDSRLGLHVWEERHGDRVVLREMVSGIRRDCRAGSGYLGAPGEFWLARVLMPPMHATEPALVFNTPYVISHADLAQWQAYLRRTLPSTKIDDEQDAYARLMKHGLTQNHWAEYVFESYSGHTDNAIFIVGLPDVDESRPHSKVNRHR